MPDFIPGLELCGRFYREAVRPLLNAHFPNLAHTAALIGEGSEVLGFDTEMSRDHDWGPRLLLFLSPEDEERFGASIVDCLSERLPLEFLGYPTGFATNDDGTGRGDSSKPYPHRVIPTTLHRFFENYLNFDLEQSITPADWLTFPEQKLSAITSGAVYHDAIGLGQARNRFLYYPHDVWLFLLVAGWTRIGQEEHLMGRAGYVGDEVGSALIGARLVRDIMRLCFLMERKYAPYPKWFGTAFRGLECGENLLPVLERVLHTTSWQERESHLCEAYTSLANKHNELQITEPLPTVPQAFFGRPFQVIHLGGGFAEAILRRIKDPDVLCIAKKRWIGSIDQFSDNTDMLCGTEWRPTLKHLYE